MFFFFFAFKNYMYTAMKERRAVILWKGLAQKGTLKRAFNIYVFQPEKKKTSMSWLCMNIDHLPLVLLLPVVQ